MTLKKTKAALELSLETFRKYERLHNEKGTEDGSIKAVRNSKLAVQIEVALVEFNAHKERMGTLELLLKRHHEVAKSESETYMKLEDGTFIPLDMAEGYADSGFWEETQQVLSE